MGRHKKKTISLSLYRSRKRTVVFSPRLENKRYKRGTPRKVTPYKDIHVHIRPSPLKSPLKSPIKRSKRKLPFSPVTEKTFTSVSVSEIIPSCLNEEQLNFEEHTTGLDTDPIRTDVDETCDILKTLVKTGKFSTSNICYTVFKDTLKWHNSCNASSMRYSDDTKEFFHTGKMLLGGQFLRYMRGFALKDTVNQHLSKRGSFSPELGEINFAVPSETVLKSYQPTSINCQKSVEPGILQENISLYSAKFKQVSHVVMFDNKKIVPNSAPIFLLDLEDEPKMSTFDSEKQGCIDALENVLDSLYAYSELNLERVSEIDHETSLKVQLETALRMLGHVTKSLRQANAKKVMTLERVTKQFEKSQEPKFRFTMNKMKTFIHEIKNCICDALKSIDTLAFVISIINKASHRYCYESDECEIELQDNFVERTEGTR